MNPKVCINWHIAFIFLVCRIGSALGMSSRIIPDSFIKASSERKGHPAYHARLGGKSFWCSEREYFPNYLKIDFPRKYKITSVSVNVTETYQSGRMHLSTQMLTESIDVYVDPVINVFELSTKTLLVNLNMKDINQEKVKGGGGTRSWTKQRCSHNSLTRHLESWSTDNYSIYIDGFHSQVVKL